MQQSFEYLKVQTAMDSITVESVGTVYLKAVNDNALEWYLSITTDMGYSVIKEFGPIFRDSEISKYGFNYSIEKKEYNEKYLCKRISTFLNLPNRAITQVQQIEDFEFEEKVQQAKDIL